MRYFQIITDLINDDDYLLWEVEAAAHSEKGFELESLIADVIHLVKLGKAHCSIRPILGNGPPRKMNTDDAVCALHIGINWTPPTSDDTDAIWLGMIKD